MCVASYVQKRLKTTRLRGAKGGRGSKRKERVCSACNEGNSTVGEEGKRKFIGGREMDSLSAGTVVLVIRVREKVNKVVGY